MTCLHLRGDHIEAMGYWLCGDCWEKLASRPTRYAMITGSDRSGPPRQEISWQAEVVKGPEGVTLGAFIRTMAKRFQRKSRGLSDEDAYACAISALQHFGDKFGDPAFDWSHAGARELADEEMTYWDADSSVPNS